MRAGYQIFFQNFESGAGAISPPFRVMLFWYGHKFQNLSKIITLILIVDFLKSLSIANNKNYKF